MKLSPTELATRLHRHRNTVLRWARAGLIPVHRRNRRILIFDPVAVSAAMENNNLKPGKK